MDLRLLITGRNGAPWYSRCGGEAYNNKVRACISNRNLTTRARELLEGVLRNNKNDNGLSVVEEGGIVKLVCRRDKIRVTVQIEHAHRFTTAAAINALAARLGEIRTPEEEDPEDACAAPDVVLSPKISFEARLKARASLGGEASQELILAKAHFIELWGHARVPREA